MSLERELRRESLSPARRPGTGLALQMEGLSVLAWSVSLQSYTRARPRPRGAGSCERRPPSATSWGSSWPAMVRAPRQARGGGRGWGAGAASREAGREREAGGPEEVPGGTEDGGGRDGGGGKGLGGRRVREGQRIGSLAEHAARAWPPPRSPSRPLAYCPALPPAQAATRRPCGSTSRSCSSWRAPTTPWAALWPTARSESGWQRWRTTPLPCRWAVPPPSTHSGHTQPCWATLCRGLFLKKEAQCPLSRPLARGRYCAMQPHLQRAVGQGMVGCSLSGNTQPLLGAWSQEPLGKILLEQCLWAGWRFRTCPHRAGPAAAQLTPTRCSFPVMTLVD